MSNELTDAIMRNLQNRKSLESNEVELFERMLSTRPHVSEKCVGDLATILLLALGRSRILEEPEQRLLKKMLPMAPNSIHRDIFFKDNVLSRDLLKAFTPVLKNKDKLLSHEKRLLGQLAVIGFKQAGDGEKLELLNFPNAQKIQLVRIPRQLKVGQEMQNKALFSKRIQTGKRWMSYLPRPFHDELVCSMFLEVDQVRATKVLQKYYNKHLRVGPADSSTFKSFVGLNDAEYVRLMRGNFYFAGMRIYAPIKAIYKL